MIHRSGRYFRTNDPLRTTQADSSGTLPKAGLVAVRENWTLVELPTFGIILCKFSMVSLTIPLASLLVAIFAMWLDVLSSARRPELVQCLLAVARVADFS